MRTMRRALLSILTLAFLLSPSVARAARDPELVRVMALVDAGDLEGARDVFDPLIRRLTLAGDKQDLADAYVYMGATHALLNFEATAQGACREALKLNPLLDLASNKWPPKVLRNFTAAREGLAGAAPGGPGGNPADFRLAAATAAWDKADRDTMSLTIKDPSGQVVASFGGVLTSGNIQSSRTGH